MRKEHAQRNIWWFLIDSVMSRERLISGYDRSAFSSSHSLRFGSEAAAATRIFDELPTATIVSVSRPDASDITPLLLSYTIEFQYKQVASIHRCCCFARGVTCSMCVYVCMRVYIFLKSDSGVCIRALWICVWFDM